MNIISNRLENDHVEAWLFSINQLKLKPSLRSTCRPWWLLLWHVDLHSARGKRHTQWHIDSVWLLSVLDSNLHLVHGLQTPHSRDCSVQSEIQQLHWSGKTAVYTRQKVQASKTIGFSKRIAKPPCVWLWLSVKKHRTTHTSQNLGSLKTTQQTLQDVLSV